MSERSHRLPYALLSPLAAALWSTAFVCGTAAPVLAEDATKRVDAAATQRNEPRRVEPLDPPVDVASVRALIEQGRLGEARSVVDAILARSPDNLEARMRSARLYLWDDDVQRAEREVRSVVAADAFHAEGWRLLSNIQVRTDRVPEAVESLRRAQLCGADDVGLRLRLIDLYLQIDRPDLAQLQLLPGMPIPPELEDDLARRRHPVTLDAFVAATSYRDEVWTRARAGAAWNTNRHLTLYGAAGVEQRPAATAFRATAQAYLRYGRLASTFSATWTPNAPFFLPPLNLWADIGLGVLDNLQVGLWGRYANYEVADLYAIGPIISLVLGRWKFSPGYLLVVRAAPAGAQYDHTIYGKIRFEQSNRTAWFLWAYLGQEAVFTARSVGIADESNFSTVFGFDHWLNTRWGLRAMLTWWEQLRIEGRGIEALLAVRVRL